MTAVTGVLLASAGLSEAQTPPPPALPPPLPPTIPAPAVVGAPMGRYNVGAYLWIELGFVVATVLLAIGLFSRRVRPLLAKTVPLLRKIRLERPIRAVYEGIHSYRGHPKLLAGVFALTLAVQSVRVLAIWSAGKAVGVELSPRPYYVMGPLLFLVLLMPFTVNGIAVRESFFVSFLGGLGVDADKAFATGFLFFAVTICLSIPGALLLGWQSVRGLTRPSPPQLRDG